MSEYICNSDDKCGMCELYKTAEEIVRCKDCRHFSYGDDNGTGSDWCDYHEHIAWSRLGYCAWAERREQ